MKNRVKERKGFALITVILGLVLMSILGLAILSATTSNFKMVKIDSESQRAYYIAEAGINKVADDIYEKVKEISGDELSHDKFFQEISDSIKESINFEGASAEISFEEDINEDSSLKKETRTYLISSKGMIGSSSRTVSISIDVSHKMTNNIPSHLAFSNALYSGGTGTMPIGTKTTVDGSIFAHDIKFESSSTKVNGTIRSKNSVQLNSAVEVSGDIFAKNGKVDIVKGSSKVFGDIHSKGEVNLSSGTELKGDIFSKDKVNLSNSNAIVTGDINAVGDVSLGSESKVKSVYTKGSITSINSNVIISGDAHAVGDVSLGQGSQVNNVHTNSKFTSTGSNVIISGNIKALGDVSLGQGSKVNNIYTKRKLMTEGASVIISGNINGVEDITLGNSWGERSKVKNIYTKGQVSIGAKWDIESIESEESIKLGQDIKITGDISAKGNVGDSENGRDIEVRGAIYSGGSTHLRDYANYKFHGPVHAAGTINIGRGCSIFSDVVSAMNVNNLGEVTGSITKNGSPIKPKDIVDIEFEVELQQPQAPISPNFSSFDYYEESGNPPLTEDLIGYIPENKTINISTDTRKITPGEYGKVKFDTKQGGTIVFESGGGDYFFDSITGENQNKTIRYDFSKGGNINIYVKNNVKLNPEIEISEDGQVWEKLKDLDLESQKKFAKRIYWESHGTFEINEGGRKQWLGTMFAKKEIIVASKSYIIGSLVSNVIIKLNPDEVRIIYPSLDSDIESGDEDAGGISGILYEGNIEKISKIKEE